MQHPLFYLGVDVTHLWFQEFTSHSVIDLVILCAVVFVVCFLRTCISCISSLYFTHATLTKNNQHRSIGSRLGFHGLATLLKILDLSLGYLLMLSFMIGNLWLCLTVVLGSAISYFFTFWSRVPIRKRRFPRVERVPGGGEEEELRTFIVTSATSDNQPTQPAAFTKLEPRYTKPEPKFPSAEQRKSMEASLLLDGNSMSTFQRNQQYDVIEHYDNNDDQPTLPLRPDLIADQASGSSMPQRSWGPSVGDGHRQWAREALDSDITTKDRSDSNPLLDKYPVLRFHNIDVPDGADPASASNEGLEFDELDKLIKDLQQS